MPIRRQISDRDLGRETYTMARLEEIFEPSLNHVQLDYDDFFMQEPRNALSSILHSPTGSLHYAPTGSYISGDIARPVSNAQPNPMHVYS